jgi:hypothetical protein
MKTLKYLILTSLPLVLIGLSAQAGTGAAETTAETKGAWQLACEVHEHGDVSTMDMAEYLARWSECFPPVAVAERKTQHRQCCTELASEAENEGEARGRMDEAAVTSSERQTRPTSSVTRKHRRHKR